MPPAYAPVHASPPLLTTTAVDLKGSSTPPPPPSTISFAAEFDDEELLGYMDQGQQDEPWGALPAAAVDGAGPDPEELFLELAEEEFGESLLRVCWVCYEAW
jgi:hypothetical protein